MMRSTWTTMATLGLAFAQPGVLPPALQWPAGELNCAHGYREFDALHQKEVYYVGVHAPAGIDTAWREFNLTFEEYLDRTVGDRWVPPIRFKMKPTVDPLRDWVDRQEDVDFMYSDTGLYSCIGVEIGGQPLGTTISHLTARGRSYNLDIYGGSIVTLATNKEIDSVRDLKGKVIGAQAISDFSGAQVQFYVMKENGLDYIMDPKQVVFTDNQEDIVEGVLSGRWDVGFVRTGQIERMLDDDGEFLDPDLFKVLDPKIYVMDTGDLFPFLHSTPVFPEWPLFAKQDVDRMVSEEVQLALINFEYHKMAGDLIHSCMQDYQKSVCGNTTQFCGELSTLCQTAPPRFFDEKARCDTTRELAELAHQAGLAGRHNGFRPARSHFSLRTMQQTAGFLMQDEEGQWHCSRAETLYDGIICPEGHYRVPKKAFESQCDLVGSPCPEGYTCYCKPCIKAFEVDVLQWNEEDDADGNHSLSKREGCDKMVMCGTVEQTRTSVFRIYDNRDRDGAVVTATMHIDHTSTELDVSRVGNESYVYEFTFTDSKVGVGILEIYFDNVQIPESPFRVQVIKRNCELEYPGKGKVATEAGDCHCGSSTYDIDGQCVDKSMFAIFGAVAGFLFMTCVVYFALRYKARKSDEAWQVSVDELHFDDPVEVIGQGSFGVVLLAEYRGTKVAIKRAVKVKPKSGSSVSRRKSPSDPGGSTSIQSIPGSADDVVEEDIENQAEFQNGSMGTGSNCSNGNIGKNTGNRSGSRGRFGSRSSGGNFSSIGFLAEEFGNSKHGFRFPWSKKKSYKKRFRDSILGESLSGSARTKTLRARYCPWFDEQSRREQVFLTEMRVLARLRHPCITTVMGAVVTTTHDPMLVMEYMDYGSLHDLLNNDTMLLSGDIILQMMRDVAQGLRYLHSSRPPILHGDMKARNILIDSRFRAKLCDFGLSTKSSHTIAGTPFWLAPEYLRGDEEYNAPCDIYSIGIILYEIYSRKSPYEGEDFREVLRKICNRRINKRPAIPSCVPTKMADLMKRCWSPDISYRPEAKELDVTLMDFSPQDAEPVIEDTRPKKKGMIYEIFPKHIADALERGDKVEPEQHDLVTVVFSDIVHFTDLSHELSPLKVSQMLDRLYLAFDKIASKHKVFKVETIGDAYMGVTNLEGDMGDCHAKNIAEFAIDMINEAGKILIDEEDPGKGHVNIRVGFHSGPVVSNVIGSLNPRYGLFGDTVNTASRMESNSKPNRILCSEKSFNILQEQDTSMPAKKRGRINVKGKGLLDVFWVGDSRITVGKIGHDQIEKEDHKMVGFVDGSSSEADPNLSTVDDHLWRRELKSQLKSLDSTSEEDRRASPSSATPKQAPRKSAETQKMRQKRNQMVKRISA